MGGNLRSLRALQDIASAKHGQGKYQINSASVSNIKISSTKYKQAEFALTRQKIPYNINKPGQCIIFEPIDQAACFQSSNTSPKARISTIHHFLPCNKQWTKTKHSCLKQGHHIISYCRLKYSFFIYC